MREVKPWVSARASFRVQPVKKGAAKGRLAKLLRDREALSVGISRAPYVDVMIGDSQTRALLDTGADWSLLDESMLTGSERAQLKECNATGQGVNCPRWQN